MQNPNSHIATKHTFPFPDALFDALEAHGYYVMRDALPAPIREALYCEAIEAYANGRMHRARIGRATHRRIDTTQRGDSICWIEGQTDAQRYVLAFAQAYREALNRRFFLGLRRYEAHMALYPEGSFYKKHFDNFQGRNDRIVTTVFYLNPRWERAWGGALVIYDNKGDVIERIFPEPGMLVTFMSEALPHEVSSVTHPRVSVAGWLRRDG